MSFLGQTDYDHKGPSPKTGVLITNLGTPDAPTSSALRRYLREFLSDPRVVEIPRVLWYMILYLFILPFRPANSARLYQQIWTENGSPLMDITLRQGDALKLKLDQAFGENQIPIEIGMRYGNPSIASALDKLAHANVRNVIALPLYPQYSGATVGSTFDAIADHLKKTRWVPELKFISGYHQHPNYITALSQSIRNHVEQHGMPQKLIFSYHGTPEHYLKNGDPYYCYCMQTTRLVVEELQLDPEQTLTTFQSRFGKAPWLKPYTDETLKGLPDQGVNDIAIICPGFSADCLETIEEIEAENRGYFIDAGGKTYHYIPCLNDNAEHIELMFELVKAHLPGG